MRLSNFSASASHPSPLCHLDPLILGLQPSSHVFCGAQTHLPQCRQMSWASDADTALATSTSRSKTRLLRDGEVRGSPLRSRSPSPSAGWMSCTVSNCECVLVNSASLHHRTLRKFFCFSHQGRRAPKLLPLLPHALVADCFRPLPPAPLFCPLLSPFQPRKF